MHTLGFKKTYSKSNRRYRPQALCPIKPEIKVKLSLHTKHLQYNRSAYIHHELPCYVLRYENAIFIANVVAIANA